MHGNFLPLTERWLFKVTSMTSSQVDTSSISEDLPISNTAPLKVRQLDIHSGKVVMTWSSLAVADVKNVTGTSC